MNEKLIEGICPKCGEKAVKEFENSFFCTTQGCDFKLSKVHFGAKISNSIFTKLLNEKKTELIEGFKSTKEGQEGKVFSAYLIINDENNIKFQFPSEEVPDALCPKCGKPLVEFSKGIRCSDHPDCDFTFWYEIYKKKLDVDILKQLLEYGHTDVITGFVGFKSGKKFDSALKFDENFKIIAAL